MSFEVVGTSLNLTSTFWASPVDERSENSFVVGL